MMSDDTPQLKAMQRNADNYLVERYKAFNEIQTSGNPLTPEEVAKLIERFPDRYSIFRAWAAPKQNPSE